MALRWYLGADHAGVSLKKHLAEMLRGLGDKVEDLGTDDEASVDYPDYGAKVGRAVAAGGADARGLIVCGTGIGISIAANKVRGVRAGVPSDLFATRLMREHNDANVIAIGSRVVGPGVAEQALRVFRDTKFEGGRHGRRVEKLGALDRDRQGG